MKQHWMKALALLLALALTAITVALAEESAAPGDAGGELMEVVESTETEPVAGEVGEFALDDIAELPAEQEPAAPEAPADAEPSVVQAWWFIVGDEAVAVLEAREGDEIQLPDAPAAPEGMAFDGWYYEDETPLAADADGDGAIDAVIAHPDPLTPEVNVFARFVDAGEPSPDGEGGAAEGAPSADDANAEGEETAEAAPSATPEGEGSEQGPQPSAEGEADEAAPAMPTANALTYTGEAQALVSGEGWLYSLDGESYGEAIPAAIDAGEYTVYYIPADAVDAQPQTLTVTVAKADVVFTPPVAAATGE